MDIICRDCIYWGYNNGKPMNDVGESRCLRLKRRTHACQYCSGFSSKRGRRNAANNRNACHRDDGDALYKIANVGKRFWDEDLDMLIDAMAKEKGRIRSLL